MLKNDITHVLSLNDWGKKDHLLTECRKLVLRAVWWNDNKLISRHVEFQVRTQLAVGEFR